MNLIPYDKNEVICYKKTKNFELLTEFANSNYDVAMVDNHGWKNAKCGVNCLRGSIARFKMDNIVAFMRKGKIFLAKKSGIR